MPSVAKVSLSNVMLPKMSELLARASYSVGADKIAIFWSPVY
jgi:hypothetical protein